MNQAAQVDNSILTTLYRAASLVGSPIFSRLFYGEDFRFDNDPSALFAKLRDNLLFQMRQSISSEFLRGWRTKPDAGEVPFEVAAKQLATQMIRLADYHDGQDLVAQKDQRFIVKQGASILETSHQQFNITVAYETNVILSQNEPAFCNNRSFYVRNFLSELGKFIESRHTLAYRTLFPGYETMLKELMKDISYFTRGYPHDVLAHDVWTLREQDDVTGIQTRTEYCSSLAVDKNSTLPPPSYDFRLYRV